MDFVSMALVTLKQPTGFWQSILNAFKSGLGTYISAVILIAVIVRILFCVVDVVNKKITMKNAEINNKMKPELDAAKAKYGNDPALLQQKTNEIYKKYQFNMMGSCIPMLVVMVLQFTVFLTLWNSLQAVSNFNIVEKYENMKSVYANVINLNENEDVKAALTAQNFAAGDTLIVEVDSNEEGKFLKLYVQKEGAEKVYLEGKDVKFLDTFLPEGEETKTENQVVLELIQKYVKQEEVEEEPKEETQEKEGEEVPELPKVEYQPNDFSVAIQSAAEKAVLDNYLETQESFLWIRNIYKSESPVSPLFTKAEIKNYVTPFYSAAEKEAEKNYAFEEQIFDNVVAGIDTKSLGVNGYYILTIIAVATSVLSLWLSNFLMRKKDQPKQKQGIAMYFIMPLIIGIFTFMYTSLFAIYLIVGQLMMLVLTPLTTLIVKKWNELDQRKKKAKTEVVVDYRRKDI